MSKLTDSQLAAVKSVDKNVLVAAGAGSGKTSVLVERTIEILRASPEAKFSQILAVTYTRKAASEMQARIKQAVKKLALQTDADEQAVWSRHLAEIDTAKIGTIHSLCEAILQSFSFEAGVDPQLEQLDDIARITLQKLAAKEALRVVIAEKSAEHALLLAYSLDQLESWLNNVLSSPLRYKQAIEKFANWTEVELRQFLIELLRDVQTRVIKQFVNDPSFQRIRAELIDMARSDAETTIGDIRLQTIERMSEIEAALKDDFKAIPLATSWVTLTLLARESTRRGKKNDQTRYLKDLLKSAWSLASESVRPWHRFYISPEFAESDLEVWQHTKLLMALAERALAIYQKIKASEGVDYDDLIEMVSTALMQDKSKIKEHYHRTLSHILVDEFQDTNLIQANLIKALAGPDTKRFLIGDDKQSIYKFQGAEVALFNQVLSEFGNKDNDSDKHSVVTLSESFRSHPKIVDFFNAVFETLFVDDTTLAPYHAIYRPLTARAEAIESDKSEHVEVIECEAEPSSELPDLEAKTTAAWIVEAVNSGKLIKEKDGTVRPIEVGDVAVLVAKNDMFPEIEQALGAVGIPYVRLGGRGFLERQEIFDMENLLRFLHNQNDDHALIGLLRAPFCAVPDDLIHKIFVNQEDPFFQVLAREAKARRPGNEVVSQAYFLLNRFVQESHFLTVAQLLRQFIQATSYDITLLRLRNGKQRSRNVWKLVQMASRRQELTCGEFADHLSNMRELNVVQKDAPVDAKNSVKLMTIHSSKGLEFPAVILPRLGAQPNFFNRKILFHKDYGLALDDTRLTEQVPPLYYRLANWLDQDMEAAEKRRLLYVAITRARDYLTILIPSNHSRSQEQTFANWLKKIIFKPGAFVSQENSSVLCVPGTPATFAFRPGDSLDQLAQLTVKPRVSLSVPTPPTPSAKLEPPPTGKTEQLSIFSLLNKPSEESISVESSALPTSPGGFNYSLLEPHLSDHRELKNNSLATARISPRQGKLELSRILVGNYFHALLERLKPGQNKCDDTFFRNVALTQGAEIAHKDVLAALVREGQSLISTYFASELFLLIKTAVERHHELPYMMVLDDKLDTRRPDLLLRKPDRSWHVIDYKTDTFAVEDMAAQAAQHRKQLEAYASELSQLLDDIVLPHLYFAQHGLLFPLR